ncbi:MAG: hypothetical protein EBQ48_02490 [Betaproteobacteria bacterium]|nr:hypothetical protein [Betaproteobacteria bacterium]
MTDDEIHVLKGLPRLRYRRPQESAMPAKDSLYRWWWEFLRLSKDYWVLTQTTANPWQLRTRDEELIRVYRRFGDVFSLSFESWWEERGYRAFRERDPFPKVTEVARLGRDRVPRNPDHDHLWLDVPLKLSQRTIQRQVSRILKAHAEQRLSDRRLLTTAEFQIQPTRLSARLLQRTHEVYCLHRELIAKPMALNRLKGIKRHRADYAQRADLFRIGKLLRLSPSHEGLSNEATRFANQNRMRVAVSQLVKKAQWLIANCERGLFPSYEPYAPPADRFTDRQRREALELEAAWWALDLHSEASADKLASLRMIHYEEAERSRQLHLTAKQPRTVIKGWV